MVSYSTVLARAAQPTCGKNLNVESRAAFPHSGASEEKFLVSFRVKCFCTKHKGKQLTVEEASCCDSSANDASAHSALGRMDIKHLQEKSELQH